MKLAHERPEPDISSQTWTTPFELTLAAQIAGREALERVIDALQALVGWPSAELEVPALILGEAVRRALRARAPPCGLTLRVRVARGAGRPNWPEAGGWGFFIVHRREERPPSEGDTPHDTFELYLYAEGGGPL